MQPGKSKILIALAAVLLSVSTVASAAFFVRVPTTHDAKITNGGLSPAATDSKIVDESDDDASASVNIAAHVVIKSLGSSYLDATGLVCMVGDYTYDGTTRTYSVSSTEAAVDEGTVDVSCSNAAFNPNYAPGTYSLTISVDPGTGPSGDRLLQGIGDYLGKTVRYQIYTDPARTQVFGATPIHATITMPSLDGSTLVTAFSAPIPVYLKVFAQDGVTANDPGQPYVGEVTATAGSAVKE